MKLVEVKWKDSAGAPGWADNHEWRGLRPLTCSTAGYLYERTKEHISVVLCHDLQDPPRVNSLMVIPLKCVTSVRILGPRSAKKRRK
jgi:hypothetical protein